MHPDMLQWKIKQKKSKLIVDVRSAPEYKSGHVRGAIQIPFWKILYHRDFFTEKQAHEVLLCCEHGPRIWLAGGLLRLVGITGIDYIDGYMSRWTRENRSLQKR